ncbi:hypothetical protein CSB09_03630 [Candidatus Gracilibacteria bacterium]|nr:MAG: hypothetical protein CSB09_03630 [Candidatus Gracilibacteria bacterium]
MKNLDKQLQKIVDTYFKDLKSFIKENRLDPEYIKDIEERVFEKIEGKNPQNSSDIKNILEEIGSPEEIFSEELENTEKVSVPRNSFLQKIINTGNKVIFLGVFKELGDKTSINANIYRILFLALLFLSFIIGGNVVPILFVGYFLGFLILRTGIFRFFFSIIIMFGLIAILIPSIILFGAYLADFSVGNMYPFMDISPFFPIGMVIGIFSLIILIIVFFQYGFFRKFSLNFFTTGLVFTIIAITFGGAVAFDFMGKYSQRNEIQREITVDLKGKKEITLSDDTTFTNQTPQFFDTEIVIFSVRPKDINKSTDDKIHIKYSMKFQGNNEIAEKAKQFVKGIKTEMLKNNNLQFSLEVDIKRKYSFIPMFISIDEILIPENISFSTDFSRYRAEDLEIEKKYEIFKKYNFFCKNYIFETNKEKLKCIIDEEHAEQIKKDIKYDILRDNLEYYIPLKFTKKHYYWDAIGKFTPKGNDIYSFYVSDGPTKFSMEAKIIENTEKQIFEVKEVKIIDYEGEFHKEWYKNPEILIPNETTNTLDTYR